MTEKSKWLSRRGFLGAGLLLPFLSAAQNTSTIPNKEEDDEYTTMLTAKGGVVRVRKSALKNAKIVKKNMSNKSLLDWLKLKG